MVCQPMERPSRLVGKVRIKNEEVASLEDG
jgi:hypothetical protein